MNVMRRSARVDRGYRVGPHDDARLDDGFVVWKRGILMTPEQAHMASAADMAAYDAMPADARQRWQKEHCG